MTNKKFYVAFDGERIWEETIRSSRKLAISSFLHSMEVLSPLVPTTVKTWPRYRRQGYRIVPVTITIDPAALFGKLLDRSVYAVYAETNNNDKEAMT